MADNENGTYNNDSQNMQINRTPSRSYNKNSAMDLLVARNEVNRQTQQFLDQIKNMTTEINGILKSIEQSNTKGSKTLVDNAKVYLATMKNAQDKGEMSVEAQLDFMKQYSKILNDAAKKQITMTDATDEQVKNANRLLNISKQYAQQAKELQKALDGSADNMATRLSKGIGSFRKEFQDLANTLNIDKLVNGSAIANKIDIMNQTKQNFGITTNREFETFKNDLIGQMQNLNSQFGQSLLGSDDLKSYLQNASAIGITQTSVAQDQLQALLLGNKYLGQSLESQSLLYKYMKRSGDNDLTNRWNKIIVGLLNSQLNLSKEELDNLTKSNLELGDKLYSMGMGSDIVNAFTEGNMAVTGSISSALGEGKGSQYNDFLASILDSNNLIFAELQYNLANMIKNGASGEAVFNEIMGNPVLKNVMSGLEASSNPKEFLAAYDLDESSVSIYRNMSDNLEEILNNIKDGNYSVDEALNNEDSVTDYVKNTTVAGFEERLMNKLGLWFDKLPWNGFITMGNTAFGLFVAQKGLEAFGGLIDFFKGGGLKGLLNGFLGNGSVIGSGAKNIASTGAGGKALGMLGTGAVVLGLTAGTISALGSYFTSKREEAYSNQYDDNLEALKGTAYEGNTSVASANTVASSTNSMTAFGTSFSNATNGIGYLFDKLSTKDKDTLNQSLTKWMYQSGVFTDSTYALAWALMMDQVGSLDSLKNLGFNFTHDSLVDWFKNSTGEDVNNLWYTVDSILKAGHHPYKDNNNGRIKTYSDFMSNWKDTYDSNTGGLGGSNGLGANMGGGSPVPSGYPWRGTAGYPKYPSGKTHTGVDFGISQGTPVGAAVSGTVAQVNDSGSRGYGRHVIVQGDNGKWFVYGHLSQPKVSKGQHVDAGNLIGLSGNTGNSTGPHLHFEARNDSRYGSDISPYPYLTNGLFNPNGQASGNLVKGNTITDSEDYNKTDLGRQASIRYNTRISSLSAVTTLGTGGPESDTTTLENTMNKKFDELIGVITSLSERQDSDSMILQALSNSTRRPTEFGGVR